MLLLGVLLLPVAAASGRCGRVDDTRIVGGEPVTGDPYPWFVALTKITYDTVSVYCGGALITDRHVLTAAHCYGSTNKANLARMYTLVYQLKDKCTQKGPDLITQPQALKVDIHQNFNMRTILDDIALITLEQRTSYTPICLPHPGGLYAGRKAIVIGLGSTYPVSPPARSESCKLQQASVTIKSRAECLKTPVAYLILGLPNTICAGGGSQDTCQGDSGGPMQYRRSDGSYEIIGITSFGLGCAEPGYPGVYTKVDAYLGWINKRINPSHSSGHNVLVKPGLPFLWPNWIKEFLHGFTHLGSD